MEKAKPFEISDLSPVFFPNHCDG